MGEVTGGDLYKLWRVSQVNLPRVADVFYDATRSLGGAADGNDEGGFRENEAAYPGATTAMTSTIGNAWAKARDEFQQVLVDVGGSVMKAAQGVSNATQLFVDTDQVGADALQVYLDDPAKHDKGDEASNPPAEGADDNPGEPDLPND